MPSDPTATAPTVSPVVNLFTILKAPANFGSFFSTSYLFNAAADGSSFSIFIPASLA